MHIEVEQAIFYLGLGLFAFNVTRKDPLSVKAAVMCVLGVGMMMGALASPDTEYNWRHFFFYIGLWIYLFARMKLVGLEMLKRAVVLFGVLTMFFSAAA